MGVITDRTWEKSSILIEWEPLEGQTFNPEFSGYTAAHYATGNPELGWCLYSRGAGGCWNQRTKEIKAPASGLQPKRIDGVWYWVEPEKFSEFIPKPCPIKAILKSSDGLIQLVECPECRYMVSITDVVWTRQPIEMADDGEIKSCQWCENGSWRDGRAKPEPDAFVPRYLGSTQNGERFIVEPDLEQAAVSDEPANPLVTIPVRIRVPPPTQTMIEDAGPPSTFVQDRLAEAFAPVPKAEIVISFPEVENIDFKPIDRSDRKIEGRVSIRLNGDEKLAFPIPAEIKNNTIYCAGFSLPEEAQELFQMLLASEDGI